MLIKKGGAYVVAVCVFIIASSNINNGCQTCIFTVCGSYGTCPDYCSSYTYADALFAYVAYDDLTDNEITSRIDWEGRKCDLSHLVISFSNNQIEAHFVNFAHL